MVTIYVEGGGDTGSLKTECRKAFSELLNRAGLIGRMPKVKAAGGRQAAFDSFRSAHAKHGEFNLLLVDSEAIPSHQSAWAHLKDRDNWERPNGTSEDQAQLMVVCMETWLLADPEAMTGYFGQGFNKTKLPTTNLEGRSKNEVYRAIELASGAAKPKGKYGKARDSYKLLSRIDPSLLETSCAWAKRFFDALRSNC